MKLKWKQEIGNRIRGELAADERRWIGWDCRLCVFRQN